MKKEKRLVVILLFTALTFIWGSAFILIKKGLLTFSAEQVVAIRIFVAFLVLFPFAIKSLLSVSKKEFLLLLFSGLLGSFLPAYLFALAQTKVDSGFTSILGGLTPVFTFLIGIFIYRQAFVFVQVLGIIIAFLGASLLIGASFDYHEFEWLPSILIVLATMCYAINLNLVKHKMKSLSPMIISSVSLLFVGPVCVWLFWKTNIIDIDISTMQAKESLYALVLLGSSSTALALVLFNKLVKYASPVLASSVTYTIPLVALGWGYLDGEVLTSVHLGSLILVLSGVYLITRSK